VDNYKNSVLDILRTNDSLPNRGATK